ncbi:MAG: glycine--tRNA ligase [Nanoarchaeota archaeon]
MISIEELSTFCKKKGFVYQSSEIYGGISGFFDFGNLGVELNNNIKSYWWKTFVKNRDDIFGMDGSIITNRKVWEASGHVDNFMDLIITCSKCNEKIRADHFIEDTLKIPTDGFSAEKINELILKNNLKCFKCGGKFKQVNDFNLMFKTTIGPKNNNDNISYLRPETAQLIFTNFKLIADNNRAKLPFGIAQIGKAFRNEISPRDFLFRAREFEQMEIEYFIHPNDLDNCPFIEESFNTTFNVLTAKMQSNDEHNAVKISAKDAFSKKLITPWHIYWLHLALSFYTNLGCNPDNFRLRQHVDKEKSHYALDTWDVEYKFPFGWKELTGAANRTDFDLKQHIKHSKKDLSLFDENTKKKIIPYVVAEPSFGVGRCMTVLLLEAYNYDKDRGNIILKLDPLIAPIKFAVYPLVNKLNENANKLYKELKTIENCIYDKSGSIGRRYARADEIGILYCITYDFDSINDNSVTIRYRDTGEQKRIKIKDLKENLIKLLKKEKKFDEI